MPRVLLREGVGCWGLPLSIAYLLWLYSGAFPSLGTLAGFSCLIILSEGMSARFDRQRRCLHDRLAGTRLGCKSPFNWRRGGSNRQRKDVLPQDGATKEVAKAKIVLTPESNRQWRHLGSWMRQHLILLC
jgi:hypothetical protein